MDFSGKDSSAEHDQRTSFEDRCIGSCPEHPHGSAGTDSRFPEQAALSDIRRSICADRCPVSLAALSDFHDSAGNDRRLFCCSAIGNIELGIVDSCLHHRAAVMDVELPGFG